MNILKIFLISLTSVITAEPRNSSETITRAFNLSSLLSGKGPGHVQTFRDDYTPQLHDHSHKHKYKHKHAHQHRWGEEDNHINLMSNKKNQSLQYIRN